jgi:hypothetical protein
MEGDPLHFTLLHENCWKFCHTIRDSKGLTASLFILKVSENASALLENRINVTEVL